MNTPIALIVLAAGKGTRMNSPLPKVLHTVAGIPMVIHALNAAQPLQPEKIIVITGYGAEEVEATVRASYPQAQFVRQTEQLGTAHAVRMAETALAGFQGTILIMYGDAPLIPTDALQTLVSTHLQGHHVVTEITTHQSNPFGFGRIVRHASGAYLKTVEEKDCTDAERTIIEVSTCLFAFQSPTIWPLLAQIDNNNPKGEYYLTRIMPIAQAAGHPVGIVTSNAGSRLLGANSPAELAAAEALYHQLHA